MKNIRSLHIVIVLSLLLLTGCNEPVSRTKTEIPEEPISQTTIESKEWKTYIDNEYGFTINYPKTIYKNPLRISQGGNKFTIEKFNELFGWEKAIYITIGLDIETEKDIEAFIKKEYFEACEMAEISEEPLFSNLYPVSITMSGSLGKGCWINWITYLLYSQEKKKIVAIDLGQEPPLVEYIDDKNEKYIDYNKKTVESFRFLE